MQWLLSYGANGSRILVTTENNTIAEHIGTSISIPLGGMSTMYSWALFSHHAFNGRNLTIIPPKIMEIGQKIVNQCNGVPIMIKALAALLTSSIEQKTWEYVLESNVWDLEDCRKKHAHFEFELSWPSYIPKTLFKELCHVSQRSYVRD